MKYLRVRSFCLRWTNFCHMSIFGGKQEKNKNQAELDTGQIAKYTTEILYPAMYTVLPAEVYVVLINKKIFTQDL